MPVPNAKLNFELLRCFVQTRKTQKWRLSVGNRFFGWLCRLNKGAGAHRGWLSCRPRGTGEQRRCGHSCGGHVGVFWGWKKVSYADPLFRVRNNGSKALILFMRVADPAYADIWGGVRQCNAAGRRLSYARPRPRRPRGAVAREGW